MSIVLNGTTGITAPDIDVTAQTTVAAFDAGITLGGSTTTLDDYEIGTHASTLTTSGGQSFTLSTNTLSYQKVGSLVHIQGQLVVSAVPTSPTGRLKISLPFAVGSGVTKESASFVLSQGTAINSNQWGGFTSASTSEFNLYRLDSTSFGSGADNAGPVGVGDGFWVSITYETTA